MTEIFKGHLKRANRRFLKDSNHSITIEDQVIVEDSTRFLTWAIMTTANVVSTPTGAILKQDGKQLNLKIMSPANMKVSILSMDPPPLKLDRRINNLKRVEVRVPAKVFPDGKGVIKVRLSIGE